MKRKALNVIFLLLISFGVFVFIYELFGTSSKKDIADYEKIKKNEYFEPSFSRLTSVSTFVSYCDSLYGHTYINSSDTEQYATIVSQILRGRFYHGYSYYELGQNSFGYLFAPLIKKDLSAIVIPNDILKHPMAACSQQSIVGMEVFKMKGIKVRKIGFFADGYGGHFCFEAFFGGKWHFFDPDLEPKLSLMVSNHFPSVFELVKNDSLLHQMYFKQDKDYIEKLFLSYSYGPVNKFPATNARIYQHTTKFLSYTSWLLLVLLYLFMQKKILYSKKKEVCAELQDSLVPEISA